MIENNFDIQDWWKKLDITWKRLFKRTLDINHNPDLDDLKEILKIESIDCSGSHIVSLEPLQHLKKLRILNCSNTDILSLDKIKNLTLITELDCSKTKIKSLEPLVNFKDLWILKANNLPLESLKGMEGLLSLEYFYCANSLIRDIEPLRSLNHLKLVDCKGTLIQSIKPLEHLPNYKKIVLFDGTSTTQNERDYLDPNKQDPLFDEAARIVVENQIASASLLQRKLKVGYNRSGRMIHQLEAAGIIGPFEGNNNRVVLIHDPTNLESILKGNNINKVSHEIGETYILKPNIDSLILKHSPKSNRTVDEFESPQTQKEVYRPSFKIHPNVLPFTIIAIGSLVFAFILFSLSNGSFAITSNPSESATTYSKSKTGIVISKDGVNVESKPNSTAKIVSVIPINSRIYILDSDNSSGRNTWYKINYNSQTGWIWSGAIRLE